MSHAMHISLFCVNVSMQVMVCCLLNLCCVLNLRSFVVCSLLLLVSQAVSNKFMSASLTVII